MKGDRHHADTTVTKSICSPNVGVKSMTAMVWGKGGSSAHHVRPASASP